MNGHDKRERDRRYNAKRPAWVEWYKLPEWRGPQGRRPKQLAAEPWCRFCAKLGKRVKATVVDHVDRHNGDRTKFFCGPLQSLCKPHHDGLKQSLERGNRSGCDASGMPIDPSHPWA